MNKALGLTTILVCLTLGAWADPIQTNLGYLNDDLSALFQSVSADIAPQLLQATLSSDLVGEAAFKGGFPHGTLVFPSLGVDFGHGIATVLNDDSGRDWEFVTPLPNLVQTAVGSGTGSQLYDASRQIFPYPSTNFGLGFGTAGGFEVLVDGFYWPQSLTSAVVGLLPSGASSLNPDFTATSLLVKVRKVLLRDVGPYPALSIGLGGVYGYFKTGVDLNFSNDFSSTETMNISGRLALETTLLGTGLEVDVSKRLPVITPFASAGLWYRYAEASTGPVSGSPLKLTISDTNTNTSGGVTLASDYTSVDQGLDARVSGGLEIRIWAMILHISAAFDLEDPLLDIQSFSLDGISANGFSLSTGIRWAF